MEGGGGGWCSLTDDPLLLGSKGTCLSELIVNMVDCIFISTTTMQLKEC